MISAIMFLKPYKVQYYLFVTFLFICVIFKQILRKATSSTMDSPLLPLALSDTQEETSEEECMNVGLYFPAPQPPDIVSVSGAGDWLAVPLISYSIRSYVGFPYDMYDVRYYVSPAMATSC